MNKKSMEVQEEPQSQNTNNDTKKSNKQGQARYKPQTNGSNTDNPLYTDTRYKDTIIYNDTKPPLKRLQLMRNYARILH